MTTANFVQKARDALVPIRNATIDALLLTLFAFVVLVVTGVLFTHTWLLVPIYVFAFLLAVLLRLRKAAHDAIAAHNQEQSLDEASQELSSTKTLVGVGLYWGNHPY